MYKSTFFENNSDLFQDIEKNGKTMRLWAGEKLVLIEKLHNGISFSSAYFSNRNYDFQFDIANEPVESILDFCNSAMADRVINHAERLIHATPSQKYFLHFFKGRHIGNDSCDIGFFDSIEEIDDAIKKHRRYGQYSYTDMSNGRIYNITV